MILANQKQRNILNECNNKYLCYNSFKDEDETMKNETQQFVLQDIKNCMETDVCAFYWSECYEIHIKDFMYFIALWSIESTNI